MELSDLACGIASVGVIAFVVISIVSQIVMIRKRHHSRRRLEARLDGLNLHLDIVEGDHVIKSAFVAAISPVWAEEISTIARERPSP